ncbi:MAG: hypothetical protein SW833_26400 [Cyanobacteriota bacterium]|nr:hypothetical protein [Cyanobacteriota bacterium]
MDKTAQQVKKYLAHWFQLGKKVVNRQSQQTFLPRPLFEGASYSKEFERCWEAVSGSKSDEFYLEGADCTIAELLSPAWEIASCSRCEMPIPVKSLGVPSLNCPCSDLAGWPNTELPQPRSAVESQVCLQRIRTRLAQTRLAGEMGDRI